MMVQNGPCPCTFRENICPDNLYWPVRRSSATFPTQFEIIVDGLILKIEKHFYSSVNSFCNRGVVVTYAKVWILIFLIPRICRPELVFVKSPIVYCIIVIVCCN